MTKVVMVQTLKNNNVGHSDNCAYANIV